MVQSEPAEAPAKKRPRSAKYLPTDRIAFAKQADLLRSYGVVYEGKNAPVNNQEVGPVAGLTASTSTLLNPFFVESGFLQKAEGGFVPADEVVAYARAHGFDADTAGHKLRPVVERTWFSQALKPHLLMGSREEVQALGILADAASASAEHRSSLRVLLDYLHLAGLIERDGSTIRARKQSAGDSHSSSDRAMQEPPPPPPPKNPRKDSHAEGSDHGDGQILRFSISVDIDVSEVSRWEPERITAFFGGVAQVLAAKAALKLPKTELVQGHKVNGDKNE